MTFEKAVQERHGAPDQRMLTFSDVVGKESLDTHEMVAKAVFQPFGDQRLMGNAQSLEAASKPEVLPPFTVGEAQLFAGLNAAGANRKAIEDFFAGSQSAAVRTDVDTKLNSGSDGNGDTVAWNSQIINQNHGRFSTYRNQAQA